MRALVLGVLFLIAGCSESQDAMDGENAVSGEWHRLIEEEWTLDAGSEVLQRCTKHVLTEDLYISAIRPVHPLGTHHTTLSATDDDGESECGNLSSVLRSGIVYGAGVGTEGFELPPGVAMHFPKGKSLNMSLHLFNTTEGELRGTSAIEVKTIPKSEVEEVAEALLVGPLQLSIPPGRQTVDYTCAVTEEQTVFAYMPHMHQLGTHFTITVASDGQERTLYDGAYRFDEQWQRSIDPLPLHVGDTITNLCTYENTTSGTVVFGESSTTEMCFTLMFRYPATGNAYCIGERHEAIADAGTLAPCAEPGDEGNELGVGEYCESGGDECADNDGAALCIVDFDATGYANICSRPCTSDAECGDDALCMGPAPGQEACFPIGCNLL